MGACSAKPKESKIYSINHRVIQFKSHELNNLYKRRQLKQKPGLVSPLPLDTCFTQHETFYTERSPTERHQTI